MWLTISAIAAACCNIFLKKSPEKLLFSFGAILFTCFSLSLTFYGNLLIQESSVQAITQRLFFLATENLLNYFIVGIVAILSLALTKFSVPLTLALAYFMLKEKIHTPELVAVALIFAGGIIGAF